MQREFMVISATDQREGVLITKLLWDGVVYFYSGGNEWMVTQDFNRLYVKDLVATMRYGGSVEAFMQAGNFHGAEAAIRNGAVPLVVSSLGREYRVKRFKHNANAK